MFRTVVSAIALLLVPLAPMAAVEYALREDPQEVLIIQAKNAKDEPQQIIFADWGRVAESRNKDPAEGLRQMALVEEFFKSEEFQELARRRGVIQGQLAMVMQDLYWQRERQYLDNKRVDTRFPTMDVTTDETIPATPITRRMPWMYRQNIVLLFIDGRDERQVHWLGEWWQQHRDPGKEYMPIVLAFENRAQFQILMDRYPGIPTAMVDDYRAEEHLIQAVPAIVEFPTEGTIRIRQGLGAEEIERQREEGLITDETKLPPLIVVPDQLPPRPTPRLLQRQEARP